MLLFSRISILAWSVSLVVSVDVDGHINNCNLYILRWGDCISCEVRNTTADAFYDHFNPDMYDSSCQTHIGTVSKGVVEDESFMPKYLLVSLDSGEFKTIHKTDQILFRLKYKNKMGETQVNYFAVDLELRGSHLANLKDVTIPLPLDDINPSYPIDVNSHSKWACGGLSSQFEVKISNTLSLYRVEPVTQSNCPHNRMTEIERPESVTETENLHGELKEDEKAETFSNPNALALEVADEEAGSDSVPKSARSQQLGIYLILGFAVVILVILAGILIWRIRRTTKNVDGDSNNGNKNVMEERLPSNSGDSIVIKTIEPPTPSSLDEAFQDWNTDTPENNNSTIELRRGERVESVVEVLEGDNLSENLEREAEPLHPLPQLYNVSFV